MIAQDLVNKWKKEVLIKKFVEDHKAGKKITLGSSHTGELSKNV